MIAACAAYQDGRREPGDLPLERACEASEKPGAFVWVGTVDPSPEEMRHLQAEFHLHPLAVEDALEAHQRPKIEQYGETLLVVLKPVRYVDETELITVDELVLFVNPDFLISVRHGQSVDLGDVREEAERDPRHLRNGPRAALHAIVDRVVDGYEEALEGVNTDVQEVEGQVFSDARDNPTQRIYRLESELLQFQRAAVGLLPSLDHLARKPEDMPADLAPYFRDVHDHLLRVQGRLQGLRELLGNALQANLTQVTIRQNEDMRKISAWVAIVAVPTAIAGIYGMNFEHMPELKWQYGYPLALGLMVSACSFLYFKFKRSGWL